MQNDTGNHIEPIITKEAFFLLQKEKEELVSEVGILRADNLYLKQELEKLKRMIFGSKSERFVTEQHPSQLSLGIDIAEVPSPEPQKETVVYERKKAADKDKSVHARLPLPAHLPREEKVIEPEIKVEGAKKIGEEITEILEYTPGKLYVKKYIRPKYAMPQAEGIVIGELPSLPIPKGNAGPGLLTHIIISKFVDHLPFYRQVQIFKRQQVVIAESTMNDWFSSTCRLLEPLYNVLKKNLLQETYIMADETPVPVLSRDKPGATHRGYHWVYYSPEKKLVCFDYNKGRDRAGPKAFLETFCGSLQTDGYGVYDSFEKLGQIQLLACMAHARRKFDQALNNDPDRAGFVLKKMQFIYEIERQCREQESNYSTRKERRDKESLPILEELEVWLKVNITQVLPKSAIGEAIAYTLGLWERLKRYTEDGRYEIDNNLIENSIRPVALGRKNYLFAGSHEGGQRAAMMYSFLGTCKINKVEPFAWLNDIITRIADHKANRLDELLPHIWKNQER